MTAKHAMILRLLGLTALIGGSVAYGLGAARAQEKAAKTETKTNAANEVAGKVVTADGKPAANVSVQWIERDPNNDISAKAVEKTDAQGNFRFPLPRPKLTENRSAYLLAQTPDQGIGFVSVRFLIPNRTTPPLILKLASTAVLRVGFVDPAGKPVPHLSVRVAALLDRERNFLQVPEALNSRWMQKTDAKGEAIFAGLPQGAEVRFALSDDRFAALTYLDKVDLTEQSTQQAKPIALKSGAIITGRVTFAETGKPASGVRISAQSIGVGQGYGSALTDAEGNYRIVNLAAGYYSVTLQLRGDMEKNWTGRALEKVEATPGTPLTKQDMKIIRGVVLTGKVTDKISGKPIEGVMIGVYGPARPQASAGVQSATTNADGVYQLRVPPGSQYVYVMGIFSNRYEAPKKGNDLTLNEDKTHTQDFALEPSVTVDIKPIRIRVVGADGKPAPNAQITFYPLSTEEHGGSSGETLEVGADGNVILEPPTPSVRLRARQGAAATPKAITAQSGEEITLTLKPNALVTLTGQVIDDNGKPVRNARVQVVEWWLDTGLSSGGGIPVDAQGRFTFANLFPDSGYSLKAHADGYGSNSTRHVNYSPGEIVKIEPMQLPRADSFVAGRVVDENGDPVSKQVVLLQGNSSKYQQTVTDSQGKFRFEQLVKEPITLHLQDSKGRYAPNAKRAQAGDKDVVMVKLPPASESKEAQNVNDPKMEARRQALIGKPAPEWKTAAWVNTKANLPDELRNKIVLIDFWATSCGPCVANLPAVQKVHEEYAARGVVVVGLHGAEPNKKMVEDFVKARKLTYPIAIDADEPQKMTHGLMMSDYGIEGIPTVAVVDRKGIVRYLGYGLEGAVGTIGKLLLAEASKP